MDIQQPFVGILPKDLLGYVFTFLSLPEIVQCSEICQLWREAVNSEFLWKELCKNEGYESEHPDQYATSWKDTFVKKVYNYVITLEWSWNPDDKDPSIVVENNNLTCTRHSGGHNPSIRGNAVCDKHQRYYFAVRAESIGSWFSFGFANKSFGVSCGAHTGKGKCSVAYYCDSSLRKLFLNDVSERGVRVIEANDTVGCLLDLRQGCASFFVNDVHEITVSHPAWIVPLNQEERPKAEPRGSDSESDEPKAPIEDTEETRWLDNGVLTLYPALSIGASAVVHVITNPSVPRLPKNYEILPSI